jgi:hypothetical protein
VFGMAFTRYVHIQNIGKPNQINKYKTLKTKIMNNKDPTNNWGCT